MNRVDLCVFDDVICAMDLKDRVVLYDVFKKYVSGILSFGDEVLLLKYYFRIFCVCFDGMLGDFEEMVSSVTLFRINVRDVV